VSKTQAKSDLPSSRDQEGLIFERVLNAGWVPPAFFALFTIAYFSGFIFSNDVMEGLDTRMEFYLGKEPATEKLVDLVPDNWDRYLGGTPVSGFRQPKYFPLYPVYLFTTFHRYMGWRYFFATFFAGYFTYLCVRGLQLKRTTAAIAGIAYASSPTLLTFIYPGQEGKMLVMGLLPLMVWALYRIIDTRRLVFTFILGAGVAAGIYTPHLQMLYYALLGLGILFVVRLIQTYMIERDIRLASVRSTLAAGGILLGLAVGAVGTFPAYKYTKTESRRAGDHGQGVTLEYAQSWSLHPEEIASLLIPEFVHFFKPEERKNQYWGRNPLKLNAEYFGIAVVFFAALAVARLREDQRVLPLALLIGVTLSFSLGPHTPVFRFFYGYLPGMNVLRTPGMIAFLFAFPAVILAAMSVDRFLNDRVTGNPKRLAAFGGGACLLFGFVALSPGSALSVWNSLFWSDIPADKMRIATANLSSLGAGAWIGLLWLATLTLLVCLRVQKRIHAQTFVLALLPILLIDTWRIDRQFLRYIDPGRFPDPDVYIPRTLGIIESDVDYHRTWIPTRDVQLPENVDLLTVTYHEPFILRRYDRAISRVDALYRTKNYERLLKLLNVLNVRYIAASTQRLQELLPAVIKPGSTERTVKLRPGIEAVSNERAVYLFKNRNARPFFYLASRGITVANEDLALEGLTLETFDPARDVILETSPGIAAHPKLSSAESVLVDAFDEKRGHIQLTVETEHPRILVICQNFHPYWSATIDGQPVEIQHANYVWQAVVVPAGHHIVTLTYHDSLAQLCRWVSLLSTLILIGGLITLARRSETRRQQAA